MTEITTYKEWSAYHSTVFALGGETDGDMLVAWCDLFAAKGYTPAELVAATKAMATASVQPKYRSDHLQQIQETIRQGRRMSHTEKPSGPELGECVLCGSTGRVSVPHPRCLQDYQGQTAAVLCRCALGQWFRQRNDSQQMTLEEYEAIVPDWRQRLADRQQELISRGKAETMTCYADTTLGQLTRRVANQLAYKPEVQREEAEEEDW